MAMTAAERDELHALIEGQLGERGARLLMAGLATADLEAMEERLTLRIELVRSELRTDMAGVEAKFSLLEGKFGELRGEFGELRGELGEFRGEVGQEFGKVRAEMATQNRILLFATITAGIGIVGILIGIAGLIVTAVQLAST